MRALLWLATFCSATAPDAGPSKERTGHAVIVFGSASHDEADAWLKSNLEKLPQHDAFPVVLDSAKVNGMKPGFAVVVLGIPSDVKVAKAFSRELQDAHPGTYVRQVQSALTEDASLVVVDSIDDTNGIWPGVEYASAALALKRNVGESRGNGDRRALLALLPSGKMVGLYTPISGTPPRGELWLFGSQTSCQASLLGELRQPLAHLNSARTRCEQGD